VNRLRVHEAFRKPPVRLVRVLADGFLVEGRSLASLTGRVTRTRLLRKRFDAGALVCDSLDGIQARNGTICEACRHPDCRPWLRVHLATADDVYLIDLAVVSARNFLAVEEAAAHQGQDLSRWTLRLTVVSRGRWGEVRFDRC
jgi:hypothetical protein